MRSKKTTTPAEPTVGHNSTGVIDKDRLRDIVTRIEAIEEERAELAGDVKDILSEAKSSGFDVRAIRQIIRLRRQDQADRDARQAVVDEYMEALGDLADLPLGRAALARDGLAPPV
jgi:uncharacterized protein (UPF0335 family)